MADNVQPFLLFLERTLLINLLVSILLLYYLHFTTQVQVREFVLKKIRGPLEKDLIYLNEV